MDDAYAGKFSYTAHLKGFGIVSLVICALVALFALLTALGVPAYKMDMSYAGGMVIKLDLGQQLTSEILDEGAALASKAGGVKVSASVSQTENTVLVLQSGPVSAEASDKIVAAVTQEYGKEKLASVVLVTANESSSSVKTTTITLLICVLVVLIYTAFRFGFNSALAAVICLIQNLAAMSLAYVLFRIPFGEAFLSAALFLSGVTLMLILAVYDRVRENSMMSVNHALSFSALADLSIPGAFRRVIGISAAGLIFVLVMTIGGQAHVRVFFGPLIFGILAGAYSSLFLASGLWSRLGGMKKRK